MPTQEILVLQPSDALPPPDGRMMPYHKRTILAAIEQGLARREEIMAIYELSEEELLEWEQSYDTFGLGGLKVTASSRRRRQMQAWKNKHS